MLLTLLLASASACGGFSVRVNGSAEAAPGGFLLAVGDSVALSSESEGPVEWLLVTPVGGTFWNGTDEGARLGPVATLCYSVESLLGEEADLVFTAGRAEGLPSPGTFYVVTDPGLAPGDTLRTAEPLYDVLPGQAAQFVVRPDDSYAGYLMELMGTPFVMAPRWTPSGRHQADSRLGADCAGFAIYGKRRQGFDYRYLGPRGILPYLVPLMGGAFLPGPPGGPGAEGVYRSADGASVPTAGDGLRRGDIVHFGDQVSVFYADAGMEGVLDLSDTLLQCWIGGPRFCTVAESGFAHLPVRVYRWVDETDAAGSPSLPATPPDGGTIIEGKAS